MALVSYPKGGGLRQKVRQKLLSRGRRDIFKTRKVGLNAGAPVDDTELAFADGDFLWDSTNEDIYIATNVAASTTTWTKIVD